MYGRLTKYYAKEVRNKLIPKTIADVNSSCINMVNPQEKIEDFGYLLRTLNEPKEYSSLGKRIGFHGNPKFNKDIGDVRITCNNPYIHKRKVFIFQKRFNHMQSTPQSRITDGWVVDYVSIYDTRSHSMLWNKVGRECYAKTATKGNLCFQTAEEAILFCIKGGLEYEIIYDHPRYHTLKSYAENFAFKKEQVSDVEEEEIDFKRI